MYIIDVSAQPFLKSQFLRFSFPEFLRELAMLCEMLKSFPSHRCAKLMPYSRLSTCMRSIREKQKNQTHTYLNLVFYLIFRIPNLNQQTVVFKSYGITNYCQYTNKKIIEKIPTFTATVTKHLHMQESSTHVVSAFELAIWSTYNGSNCNGW